VTATGSATEMGKIAGMVTATKRSRSPLQQELDGMTKVFGLIAWLAVAVIAIFGIARGQEFSTLVLLCISTAIASIPTGLPTFVQAMLSSGDGAWPSPRLWSSRSPTLRRWAGPRSSTPTRPAR
jgi:P-type Ca2+ transporter type 2C